MARGRPKPITWKQLEQQVRRACRDADLDGPVTVHPWIPIEEREAAARDHAYVYPDTLDFWFSSKVLALSAEHRKAIVAHEVGHCLAQKHWGSSTEDEADAAAEQWLGTKICYDRGWPGKGLQVTCARARNPSSYELPPDEFLRGSVYREPLYHGGSRHFEQGHTLRPDLGAEYGIYLTPRRRYARSYGDYLAEVYVSLKHPLVVEGKHEVSPRDLSARDVADLSRRGYDGIIVTSSTPEQASEVVVFRPEQAWVARADNPSRNPPDFVAPSRSTESEPGFLYHATNIERMFDIIDAGKLVTHGPSFGTNQSEWPDGSRQKRSYWSPHASVVWAFAPEGGRPVILRTPRTVDFKDERGTGDVYTTKPVPAARLEVLTPDGWIPLSRVSNPRARNPRRQASLARRIAAGG